MFRLLLVVALAIPGCKTDSASESSSKEPAASAGPAVEMTAAALYKKYAADHAGAFAEHKGHTLVVSGKVWGTAVDPFRVGLAVPDEPFGSILAATDEKAARAAGLDKEGASAKLKCKWARQDTEAVDISLTDCAVVE